MSDYRLPDGCYRHHVSDPGCERHVHHPQWARECAICSDMLVGHRHDAILADLCAGCRLLRTADPSGFWAH